MIPTAQELREGRVFVRGGSWENYRGKFLSGTDPWWSRFFGASLLTLRTPRQGFRCRR